jgi:anti-anti-sigma factor
MSFNIQSDPQQGLLKLEGTFNFDAHGSFRSATAELLEVKGLKALTIDLSAVAYLDSSALGMLLLAQERAQAKGIEVVLSRPSPSVMSILQVVQFGKLFEIRES